MASPPCPAFRLRLRVYRDRWGVPHIFAANKNDAARALGYIHASERLFQMEMQRRAGQGRLSEMAGPGMLGADKYIRTLGLYRLSQSSFAALSPDAQSHLQAYADGVNAWLATHERRLPPELLLMGAVPERWAPANSVVWGKLMALRLSFNYRLEMLRARLAKHMTRERMEALFPDMPSPITIQPERNPPLMSGDGAKKASLRSDNRLASRNIGDDAVYTASRASWPEDLLDLLLGLGDAASNEWVVSGQRTATGKPILANDPHLGLEAPILWYLARIVTPDMTLKGATVPGLPAVLLGQNDNIAWGLTTTHSDVQDLFVETVDPKNPGRYLTPEGSAAFEARQEVIHVKGKPDVTMTVRATRHGPVMSDIDGEMMRLAGPGKVMALAFTGLGAADTTPGGVLAAESGSRPERRPPRLETVPVPAPEYRLRGSRGPYRLYQSRPSADPQSGRWAHARRWRVRRVRLDRHGHIRSDAACPRPRSRLHPQREQRGRSADLLAKPRTDRTGESRSAPGEFRTS